MKSLKKILFDTGLLGYLSETKNKVRGMLKTGYNPKIFWETWSGDFYNQKYQHKIQEGQRRILDEMRRIEPGSVLEAGCGFGRNLKFLSKEIGDKIHFTGIDISKNLLEKCDMSVTCADIRKLPFSDNSFDMVFTHGTLMHVPGHTIRNAMNELIRVSKKYILCAEEAYWDSFPKDKETVKPNRYTFYHNYEKMLGNNNTKLLRKEYFNIGTIRYIIFLLKKTNKDKK